VLVDVFLLLIVLVAMVAVVVTAAGVVASIAIAVLGRCRFWYGDNCISFFNSYGIRIGLLNITCKLHS
jgi:uncharacterized membrane protein (DUF441 family)